MGITFILFLILIFLAVAFAGYLIAMFNGLVTKRNRVKNAWAQIDVQLKRRHDLIPNLVETAKGYLKHEKGLLENVTQARSQAMVVGGNVADRAQAENALTRTLHSLLAVVENYPDLKANQTMLALQEEIASTENKIAFARQFYNDSVMEYNIGREQFPQNIMANAFSFQAAESFELKDLGEREVPKVQF